MTSSLGSDAFAFLAITATSIFVLLLLRYYLPLRTTPAYLTIPIFLALTLPISIILLVPIDLASSCRAEDEAARGIWLPATVLRIAWRLMYWLTFALTWIILPLLGEYADSGYRFPKDRFVYSLRSNARYQLIILGCAGLAAIYIFLVNGFRTGSVKSLVMALAYCWGLIMAIYLMGHGLVALPRRLIQNANPKARLRLLQAQAPYVDDRLVNANMELDELEVQLAQLRKRKNAVSRDHEDWIEELSDDPGRSDPRVASTTTGSTSIQLPTVITDQYLANLSRKLTRARHKRLRFVSTWRGLVQEAMKLELIVDSSSTRALEFNETFQKGSLFARAHVLTPFTRFLLHSKIIPALRILFGSLLALASICIVWSEMVKFLFPHLSIVSLTILTKPFSKDESQVTFAGQAVASLWLLYMCLAALSSFSDVKVWGNRALVKRNTYGESAVWYSMQVAKLTVPLAYNFLTFLPPNAHHKTVFYGFLGQLIKLTPLGAGFDYFFPMFILFPVCATLFNLYGRVQGIFGFAFLTAEDDEATNDGRASSNMSSWREGRDLINRDRQSSSRLALSNRPLFRDETDSHISRGENTSNHVNVTTESATASARLREATSAAEEVDESVFSGFAHRFQNTFDNLERPAWLEDLSTRRPRWLKGDDKSATSSGRAESGRGIGRWFGGRPADGRVRL